MPIYMDRHDLPGVTARDVAEAHQQDLKIQDNYCCRGLTYWFDEQRGTAFCLIEAPDKTAVKEMHDNAHGLLPHQIIEVDRNVVNAFLGRIENPDKSQGQNSADLPIITEPAFRAIMVTKLMDSALLLSKYSEEKTLGIFRKHNELIQNTMHLYDGRLAKQTDDGFIVSFSSLPKSVSCALEIHQKVKRYNKINPDAEMCVRIGLSAGLPVTEASDFFGQTVSSAKRLSSVAQKDQVLISSTAKDFNVENRLNLLKNSDAVKTLTPVDENFLNKLIDTTEIIWNVASFDVGSFARRLGLSRSQLYRKTTSLTGYSPNDFIKEFRLKKATAMIKQQHGNITEIAFQSGFSNSSYFAKCFQKRFGILPSNYAKTLA